MKTKEIARALGASRVVKLREKKSCETCRYSDPELDQIIAACVHPRNKRGGQDNLDWAIDYCIDKHMKYWKAMPKEWTEQ